MEKDWEDFIVVKEIAVFGRNGADATVYDSVQSAIILALTKNSKVRYIANDEISILIDPKDVVSEYFVEREKTLEIDDFDINDHSNMSKHTTDKNDFSTNTTNQKQTEGKQMIDTPYHYYAEITIDNTSRNASGTITASAWLQTDEDYQELKKAIANKILSQLGLESAKPYKIMIKSLNRL